MWFLRISLTIMALVWGRVACQGVYLIDAVAARVGDVAAAQIVYVIGIPGFASAVLALLLLATWRLSSRKSLATAAVAAWVSFALFWPYGIFLTSGF